MGESCAVLGAAPFVDLDVPLAAGSMSAQACLNCSACFFPASLLEKDSQ